MNEEELKKKYGINNLGNPDIDESDFEQSIFDGSIIDECGKSYDLGLKKGYTLATKDVLKKIDRYFQFEFDNNVVNYTTLKNLKKFKASLKNSQQDIGSNPMPTHVCGGSSNLVQDIADNNNSKFFSEEKQDDLL